MSPLPYATLDLIRQAIRTRRIVSFVHQDKRLSVEPHALALSPRYGAFIVAAWVIGEERLDFFRYAEIRNLHLTEETFAAARPEFSRTDRRIGSIETSVPQRSRQCA